jgi:hypothetical protein
MNEPTKSEEVQQSPEAQASPTGELTTAKLDEVVGGFVHEGSVNGSVLVKGGLTGACKDYPPSEPPHITIGAS